MVIYGAARGLLIALLIEAARPNIDLAKALNMDPRDLQLTARDLCAQLARAERGDLQERNSLDDHANGVL